MKKLLLCHPLLVTAAPVLFLWANNADYIRSGEALSWLAISMTATAALQALATKVLRRPAAAALIVSGVAAMLLLHGHCFELLWGLTIAPRQRYIHAGLLGVWAILLVSLVAYVIRTKSNLERWSAAITLIASLTISFSAASLARNAATTWSSAQPLDWPQAPIEVEAASHVADSNHGPAVQPDIYYLILDGYAREDVLREHYAFDNSEFIDFLRQRGFYVADRSCANYPYTYLSLSSSLHMRYHDLPEVHAGRFKYFLQMIHRPLVASLLQARGYRYVYFSTNWSGTQCSQIADLDLNQAHNPLAGNLADCLRQTTMARLWDGMRRFDYSAANQSTFENLPNVTRMSEATFAFAHIIAPHPPYQFDHQGRQRDDLDQNSRDSYVGQLMYVNRRVQAVLDEILKRSSTPPIIIVQADHGSGFFSLQPERPADDEEGYFRERLPILNAYLVPEAMRAKLYSTISPVNTFRLLLSELGQGDYPPLPDRHFIGFHYSPQIEEVTESVHKGIPATLATPSDRIPQRR
jgi:hypothetical protein